MFWYRDQEMKWNLRLILKFVLPFPMCGRVLYFAEISISTLWTCHMYYGTIDPSSTPTYWYPFMIPCTKWNHPVDCYDMHSYTIMLSGCFDVWTRHSGFMISLTLHQTWPGLSGIKKKKLLSLNITYLHSKTL